MFQLNRNGVATWSVPVPAGAVFLGTEFLVQALVIDPTANPAGATLSRAARGVIGW